MEDRIKKTARWHMFFEGEVQFVGFRYTARLLARRHGISGWVKNLPDGRVELEAQGDPVSLRRFLLELKFQPGIRITHYSIAEIEPDPSETRFSVRGYME